ncbi:hypothetical protein AC249_AIPGENE17274 [Exaiptasia diaphana]|nr:hypothetical protein AC249_AIPGENE17274 [Exaiptasia diaphana]
MTLAKVSGHSTFGMLQLLTVNVGILGAIRGAYEGRCAFNVHPTRKHSEQDPFPDQLKGIYFCLEEKFFDICDQDFIDKLSNNGENIGKVSQTLTDVHKKGQLKVTENFGRKLFNTFHVLSDKQDVVPDDESDDDENEEVLT